MPEENIKNIFNDLRRLNPSLKAKEKELTQLVSGLLADKPKALIDDNFRLSLKKALLAEASQLEGNEFKPNQKNIWQFVFSKSFYRPVSYGLTFAVLIFLIFLPGFFRPDVIEPANVFALNIEEVGERAFDLTFAKEEVSAPAPTAEDALFGLAQLEAEQGADSRYVYQGDDFKVKEANLPVFQRVKTVQTAGQLAERSSQAKSDQLAQKAGGYKMELDLNKESINIVKEEQIAVLETAESAIIAQEAEGLSDKELIALTEQFIKDYGLALTAYGQPELVEGLPLETFQAVVYPLLIEGRKVFQEDGQLVGVYFQINPSAKEIIGLFNLSSRYYQKSFYPVEQEIDQILELAGKFRPAQARPAQEVILETPELVYLEIVKRENGQKEFLIPALAFPTASSSQAIARGKKQIILPLIKPMLGSAAD